MSEDQVHSIAEYCRLEKISRALLNKEWQQGRGPKSFKRGSRRFISERARTEYREKLEKGARS